MTLIQMKELKSRKGVPYARGHVYRLIKAGEFPKPLKLSANRVAFLETDIDKWIQSKQVAA
ncbi:AlpA family phage regulatory protein [Aminobacter sp. SR38]|jgi:prophage regulatory protein|uniref:helix-turn-helix transcriptional regulator n=1 Tax=Aminobacter sp. SR38 TaxID=2774562 RepID=UPI00177D63F7|nr:AlpA family phage regulatory protein [Aminobacter sp. SR38]QOF71422.1 AlpA family phage regulatory protein [Aminobacter sp. SR38]